MDTYRENATAPKSDGSEYWAAVPTDQLLGKMQDKIQLYYSYCLSSGRADVWRRSYRLLYGWDASGTFKSSRRISFSGEEGEAVDASANILRSLTRAMHTQITGSRPSYACRTTSNDSRSLEVVRVGNALLDFMWTEAQLEQALSQMAWFALPSGEGWAYTRWDHWGGEPVAVDPMTGTLVWSGQVKCTALKPEDVVRDIHQSDMDLDWVIVSTLENRHALAARFPEYRSEILNASPPGQWNSIRARMPSSQLYRDAASDAVPVFELWHRRTDALPSGRHAMMVGTSCIVHDAEMPYSMLPAVPMIPSLEIDQACGYGETWDLNNLQQAITSIISQVVSTRENFGARNVWATPGTRLSSAQVGQGFRIIESPQKPEVIDMGAGYVAEASAAIDLLKGLMQLQTGMNDTVLGDASKSQSGEALRMLHSMAMQYNSGLQASYARASEKVMTLVIEACGQYMQGEQIIPIVGRGNRQTVARFKGEDLQAIDSVQIEMQAASLRTSAGRLDVADKLLQAGLITDPKQYFEVQATGRLEPILDAPYAERVLIDAENERLMDPASAQAVRVLISDNHAKHISEHLSKLNDPDLRLDDAITGAFLGHVQEHMQLWAAAPPDILAATGQAQAPSAAMAQQMAAQQPSPGPGGPQPNAAPTGGPGGAGFPAMDANTPPADVGQQEPGMEPTTI